MKLQIQCKTPQSAPSKIRSSLQQGVPFLLRWGKTISRSNLLDTIALDPLANIVLQCTRKEIFQDKSREADTDFSRRFYAEFRSASCLRTGLHLSNGAVSFSWHMLSSLDSYRRLGCSKPFRMQ